MTDIVMITLLVVAIVIGFIMLSKCDVTKELETKLDLDNKIMANAEPGNYRCCMCGKKFADGGTFKRYNGKWYCLDCCDWIKKTKREAEFNKVRKTFEIKAGDK